MFLTRTPSDQHTALGGYSEDFVFPSFIPGRQWRELFNNIYEQNHEPTFNTSVRNSEQEAKEIVLWREEIKK